MCPESQAMMIKMLVLLLVLVFAAAAPTAPAFFSHHHHPQHPQTGIREARIGRRPLFDDVSRRSSRSTTTTTKLSLLWKKKWLRRGPMNDAIIGTTSSSSSSSYINKKDDTTESTSDDDHDDNDNNYIIEKMEKKDFDGRRETKSKEKKREMNNKTKPNHMESLVFSASMNYTSDPFELPHAGNTAAAAPTDRYFTNFMECPETKNLLLGSGGKYPVTTNLSMTPQLLELWKLSCDKYYGPGYYMPPSEQNNNELITSESIVMFPLGLKVITKVVCVRIIRRSDNKDSLLNTLPSLEYILIGENRRAEGPKPILWMYNQLTGTSTDNNTDSNKDNNEFILSKASSWARISVVQQQQRRDAQQQEEEEGKNSYGFHFDMEMKIRVDFPRTLLRILPMSKEKVELQGSAAVLKAIRKDMINAINSTRTSFLMYNNNT